MKRLLIPIVLSLTIISCSKKETVNNETQEDTAVATTTQKELSVDSKGLQELSGEQLTELLKTKNDTLYVTNFFATWCPPCIKEIPHFKQKMETLKGKPVKFTFVDLDNRTDWNTAVNIFVDEQKIREHTILLDGSKLNPNFYGDNFKTWTGDTIPFTFFRKGEKTHEVNGMVSEEELSQILNSL